MFLVQSTSEYSTNVLSLSIGYTAVSADTESSRTAGSSTGAWINGLGSSNPIHRVMVGCSAALQPITALEFTKAECASVSHKNLSIRGNVSCYIAYVKASFSKVIIIFLRLFMDIRLIALSFAAPRLGVNWIAPVAPYGFLRQPRGIVQMTLSNSRSSCCPLRSYLTSIFPDFCYVT